MQRWMWDMNKNPVWLCLWVPLEYVLKILFLKFLWSFFSVLGHGHSHGGHGHSHGLGMDLKFASFNWFFT